MLSWEKPLVKPMAPGSIFHHISFWSILFCNLYFPIYIIKIPKILSYHLYQISLFASGREGIDNPFIALVARFLFVCVGTRLLVRGLLLDWYLGSQKLREILTLLYYINLSSSRENQRSAEEVARRISGAVAGESTHKSRHTKYPSQTLIPHITLFAICLSFSSPPPQFSLAGLFTLSLSILPLFLYLLLLPVYCLLVWLE